MLRSDYRCVESFNVSVEVAKCGKFSQIHPIHSLFVCYYKKWPVLTEQSIHGKFQLISMSSYAKNKQQMCRVTQHCSVMSPNVLNIHKFTQYTDYLSITKKVVMTEQSIHGNVTTHKDVLLCEEKITDVLSHWTSV